MVLIPTGGVLGGKREDGREGALGQFLEILACGFLIGKRFPISSASATVEALVK